MKSRCDDQRDDINRRHRGAQSILTLASLRNCGTELSGRRWPPWTLSSMPPPTLISQRALFLSFSFSSFAYYASRNRDARSTQRGKRLQEDEAGDRKHLFP
jgi:hypothetical protein